MQRLTIALVLALALVAVNANEAKAHGGGSFSFGVGLTFSWGFGGCAPSCGTPCCYPPPQVYGAMGAAGFGGFDHGFGPGPAAWPGYGIGYAGYGY